VITQAPMMIRSCGLSSTFKAMAVLRYRILSGRSLQRVRMSAGFWSRQTRADAFFADVTAILSYCG
jgi:hypothetical protein